MSVVYSRVCDTDPKAYIAYCIASYGANFVGDGHVGGSSVASGCRGGGADSVIDAAVGAGAVDGAWAPWTALLRGGDSSVSDSGVGDSGAGARGYEVARVERRTGVSDSGGCSGLGGGHACEASGDAIVDTVGVQAAAVPASSVGDGSGSAPVVGKHRERNRRKKERKREKKVLLSSSVASARGVRSSVFDGCDAGKVKKLRETQLDALIARNEWEALRLSQKPVHVAAYAQQNKTRGLLQQMVTEQKLLNIAKKRGVQGWAETVVSDSTSSKRSVHDSWLSASTAASSKPSGSACSAGELMLMKEVEALKAEVERLKSGVAELDFSRSQADGYVTGF